MIEQHYTADEIAERLSLSKRTVQDLFRSESGTVVIANQRPGRRQRTTLRIPHSVLVRVIEQRRIR